MREELLRSWTVDPGLVIVLALLACVYLRGALVRSGRTARRERRSTGGRGRDAAHQRRWGDVPGRVAFRRDCGPGRTACYLGGLLAIWTALASPLESFAPLLLSAHMGQHMLLTMVAAPLLLLGEPFLPLLRGLPAVVRRDWLGPFIASRGLRRAAGGMVHPVAAWVIFNVTLVAWHVPTLYELALREPFWHRVEHLCLLSSATLFWWPVIQPFPSRAWWPRWSMVPYLLTADLVNTVIAASFTFAPRVIYPTYATTAPALGVEALRDQAAAGALMWVPGSIAYLVPAAVMLVAIMRPRAWRRARDLRLDDPSRAQRTIRGARDHHRAGPTVPIALPLFAAEESVSSERSHSGTPRRRRFDLLRVPIVGAVLRRPGARLALRAAILILAALIVLDGFLGPREAPMNMAGTLPWTHWRGAAVLLLLLAGNFLCMTCPFVLPRMVGSRWRRWWSRRLAGSMPRDAEHGVVVGAIVGAVPSAVRRVAEGVAARRWPRALRNKWTAVGLLVVWLVVYEAFDLWASPTATAWVIVAYFVAAFAVDAFSSGGSFCKWVCPLGQFHFVQSTVSPLTVSVRDAAVCERCTTHDCIRGNDERRGCELELFVPHKVGNLDCTFCLDCADACPHGNVGILTQVIGTELRGDSWRSSLGRLSNRPDVAVLVLVLSAGALANAAGMTGPVLDVMARTSAWAGAPRWAGAATVVAMMLATPFALAALAAITSRSASAGSTDARRGAPRIVGAAGFARAFNAIAFAVAPLGAAVWLVHFAFHLVTSWRTAAPVMVRAAHDLGVTTVEPAWTDACCAHAPAWLLPANLLALSVGTALSLWTLARRVEGVRGASFLRAWLPGAIVIVFLWAAAAWILFQPMDMRGTFGFEVIP